MATIGGIHVEELVKPGVTENAGLRETTRATKAYLVPNWFDRYAVANAILGFSSYTGHTVGLNRPLPYPDSPGIYALTVAIRGVGTPSQGPRQIAWTSAIIEVNFGVGSFDVSLNNDNSFDPAQPYVYASQTLDFGVNMIDAPGTSLVLTDGTAIPGYFALQVNTVVFNLTLHRIPFMPPQTQRVLVGDINSDPFWGCEEGHLKLDGMRTDRQFNTDGTVLQDVSMTFTYRNVAPWDFILHPDGVTGWIGVNYKHDGQSILTSSDFNELIPTAYLG